MAVALVLVVAGSLLLDRVHWSAQRPTPDPPYRLDLTIEDPDGMAMTRFYSALTATLGKSTSGSKSPVTRILHYGDSHIAADILTGSLRWHFAADFGSAGPGYILPGLSWYSRAGVESGSSPGWHVNGLGQPAAMADDRLGIAGVALSTNQPDQRLWVSADCKWFDLYLLKQPDGGKIDVFLDGAGYGFVSLKSSQPSPFYFRVSSNAAARHRVEIRTVSSGPVRVLGIAAELDSAGVVYDALGINGARATRPLSWDRDVLSSNLEHRHPDLIVISYGTNEAGDQDLDFESYRNSFLELISRFHSAAPGASILVIAPPDRARRIGSKWVSIQAMARVVSAQREAALSSGAAFCDLYDEMGGQGSIEQWASAGLDLAGPDHVHLTKSGYHLVANALYRGIEGAYLKSVWRALNHKVSPFFDLKQPDRTPPRRKSTPRNSGFSGLPRLSGLSELSGLACNTPASSTLRFS